MEIDFATHTSCGDAGPGDIREATADERLALHRLGAIISKTNKLTLVSLQCMLRAVARLRNTEQLLAPLQNIPNLPKHMAAPLQLVPARQSVAGQSIHPSVSAETKPRIFCNTILSSPALVTGCDSCDA